MRKKDNRNKSRLKEKRETREIKTDERQKERKKESERREFKTDSMCERQKE